MSSVSQHPDNCSGLGFGTWGIGGGSYGWVDDAESLRALSMAFDRGIRFYDSANIYGDGHSEELLGKAFAERREQVVIATKAGYVCYADRSQSFEAQFIRASLEASLKRLRTDYVDVFYLHSPSRQAIVSGEVHELLCRLRLEGKVRRTGVSVRSADDGLLALRAFEYDFIQVSYSLVAQEAHFNGLLDEARRRSTPVVAKAPLCYGFLTGKHDAPQRFPEDDHRSRLDQSQKGAWIDQSKDYSFLLRNGARSRAQAALQFAMTEPGVIPIPGMKSCAQVEENSESRVLSGLSPEEMHKCRQIYVSHTRN
jgi:aryl-alcohol dehydrogenase-like predicted oxidoreductase